MTGCIDMQTKSTAVINIGALISGDVESPTLEADALLIQEGKIAQIGASERFRGSADVVVDVHGATVGPGLIDSHCHVVFGDYTPRQQTVGFLASYLHGGITQVISPGEIHLPGRPWDAAGVKALAIAAQRSWSEYRPAGIKVNGGSVIIEPTLTEGDFQELAAEGVRLAKYGFGRFAAPQDGVPQVRAAQRAGIIVMCHSGGASISGSQPINAEDLMVLLPDVCGHLNGGPTSLDDEGVLRIIHDTSLALQIVQAGCLRSSLLIAREAWQGGFGARVILGSDTPTGTGVMPLGVLKTMAELASLGPIPPEITWAWATGTTAAVYGLDAGVLSVGRSADLIVMDAPRGSLADSALSALSRGDIPGISAVLVDGVIQALMSRNTPAPTREVSVTPTPTRSIIAHA